MKHIRYFVVATVALVCVTLWLAKSTARSTTLTSFSRGRQDSFLLYAHLSNRILVVERGVVRSVDTSMGNKYLYHHAEPAVSPSGRAIVFVRPSRTPRNEDIVLCESPKNEERLLLSWPGNVWSIAWSPGGSRLAFVADKSSGSGRPASLYLFVLANGQVDDLTPGIRWVSDYSSPSWSPAQDRIAFEQRYSSREGDSHNVMVVDVATRSADTVAEGWFPSWSPDGNKLAYITPNGSRCYEVNLRNNQRRLLWWSLRTLFADNILGPAVWAPSGEGALLNVTSGMKGDSREGYYVDFASGKTRRVWYDSAFEVVGWVGHGSQDMAEPKPNR